MSGRVDHAEVIAAAFHEAYELLAPVHRYATREQSRVPWPNVPDENRRLMIATVRHLLAAGVIVEADPEVYADVAERGSWARVTEGLAGRYGGVYEVGYLDAEREGWPE